MPDTPPQSNSALICDWQDWLEHLEHVDASMEDKRVLIETVWSIVTIFVDLGWDVSPSASRPARKNCGQYLDLAAVLRSAVVKSTEEEDA